MTHWQLANESSMSTGISRHLPMARGEKYQQYFSVHCCTVT